MSPVNRDWFYFLFNLDALSLYWLEFPVWSWNCENGHPCLIPDSGEISSVILHWIWCFYGFFFFFFFCEYPLSGWRSSLLLTLCWVFFFFKSQMDVRSFQMHLLRWTYGFSVSVYVGITLVDFWMPYQSFIPEINPTWSWCIILFMYCWIWFTKILLRIFTSIFTRSIEL